MDEIFLSVDVETSGRMPGFHDLLSIGACRIDGTGEGFVRDVKPRYGNAEAQALAVNGLSMERQLDVGVDLGDAMVDLAAWAAGPSRPAGHLVFVGLNAPFDWGFVNHSFHAVGIDNPFHFVPLDIKALYMGATGCSWDATRSSRMQGILSPTLSPDHGDPLRDALYQAELFRLIRNMAPSGPFPPPQA